MTGYHATHDKPRVPGFVALPPPLERLLDATIELREFSEHGDGLVPRGHAAGEDLVMRNTEACMFRRHLSGLADLIEREASALVRAWASTVRRCDSCESWFPTRDAVFKGTGLARVQLCPGCAGAPEPSRDRV